MKAVVDTNVIAYLLLGTEPFADEARDEIVPPLARRDRHRRRVTIPRDRDTGRGHLEHGAGKAAVGDDEVRAAPDHEEGLAGSVGVADRAHHVALAIGGDEAPRRSSEAERGQLRDRGVLDDTHAGY